MQRHWRCEADGFETTNPHRWGGHLSQCEDARAQEDERAGQPRKPKRSAPNIGEPELALSSGLIGEPHRRGPRGAFRAAPLPFGFAAGVTFIAAAGLLLAPLYLGIPIALFIGLIAFSVAWIVAAPNGLRPVAVIRLENGRPAAFVEWWNAKDAAALPDVARYRSKRGRLPVLDLVDEKRPAVFWPYVPGEPSVASAEAALSTDRRDAIRVNEGMGGVSAREALQTGALVLIMIVVVVGNVMVSSIQAPQPANSSPAARPTPTHAPINK